MAFASPTQPPTSGVTTAGKQQRAHHSKSRNGCITCRIRRVKCDETKPECLRCSRFGARCDGYSNPVKQRPAGRPPGEIKILPRPGPKSGLKTTSPQLWLQQLSPDLSFRNEMEERYFHTFRYNVISEISGVFHSTSLWNQTILPACHDEPFVRDAVVAISALSMFVKESQALRADGGCSTKSSRHYEFALERYGRAVRTMRSTLSNEERHLRKVVIGCLLVFCFEGFLGHAKQALLHIINGYQLLQKRLVNNFHPLIATGDTFRASNIIENSLLDFFVRLRLHAVTVIGNPGSSESHDSEKIDGDRIITNMPAAFSDIDEAHRYWGLIMSRIARFLETSAARATSSSPQNQESQTQEVLGESDYPASRINFGSSIHTPFPSDPVPEDVIVEYNKYALEIERFQQAYRSMCLSSDQTNKLGLCLQLASKSVRFLLDDVITTEECSFDKHRPEFQAIVSLAKEFFQNSSIPSALKQVDPFSMDVGILPTLYIVCKFCRDGLIRREAISLMSLSTRREGVWDSMLTARISTWLMELEEEGMVNGYIPENARARITKIHVDVSRKSATVVCMKRTGDVECGVVTKVTTIRWDW